MDLRGYGIPVVYPEFPGHQRSLEKDANGHEQTFLHHLSCSYFHPYTYESWDDSSHLFTPRYTHDPYTRGISTQKANETSAHQDTVDSKDNAQIPGQKQAQLELYLQSLSQEIAQALSLYIKVYQGFEQEIKGIAVWAPISTLDTIWSDKIRKVNQNKLEDVAEKIAKCREDLKVVRGNGKHSAVPEDEKTLMENLLRAAHKAIAFCDGIIDLAQRALKERMACTQLVRELKEAKTMLSRDEHLWKDRDTENMEAKTDRNGWGSESENLEVKDQAEAGAWET